MLKAGHCTGCGQLVWRTAVSQKERNDVPPGTRFLLWPLPTSVYARVDSGYGIAPGICYCPACAPPLGEPGPLPGGGAVLGYETAHTRYYAWYDAKRRDFWASWLRDQLCLDDHDIDELLRQFDEDRRKED